MVGFFVVGDGQDNRLARSSRGRRPRIIALLAFRDEIRYLPGYFENVAPQVDGIVALDDGSVDGSAEFVARQPGVLELLRKPASEAHEWNDSENHRLLVEASWRFEPDWLMGVDADERLERDFRNRATREILRAEREGHLAYHIIFRELWNRPDAYRADGIWGRKRQARFFKARLDHEFDAKQLHCHWAPLNSMRDGDFPHADLVIYHLRMIREGDRLARQARYERLDPEYRWQTMGYGYMTADEQSVRLEKLTPGREYEPLGDLAFADEENTKSIPDQPEPRNPTPRLAVVVLSLGNQPGLLTAVKSLLAQDEPLEIVVVNSGGGDPAGTLREAGLQTEVINVQERLYPGAARNVGIDATRAPYVAFLAADCVAAPGWASRRLRRHQAGALAVASAVINSNPHNDYALASYVLLWAQRMPGVPQGDARLYGVSYARELFERFGRFREDLRSSEDTEFNDRFAATVEIEWAPDVHTAHRQPTGLYEMVRDQYTRGRRMARALERITGKPHQRIVARNGMRRIPNCMARSWLASNPRDRGRLVRAWRLLPLAAVAYSLGALSSSGSNRPAIAVASRFLRDERQDPAHASPVTKQTPGAQRPDLPQLDERRMEELSNRNQRLERRLQARERRIEDLETRVRSLASRAQQLQRQLYSMQASRLWKLGTRLGYIRARLSLGRREEPEEIAKVPVALEGASGSRSRPTPRGPGAPSHDAPHALEPGQTGPSLSERDEEIAWQRAQSAREDVGSKGQGVRPENIVWIFGHQWTGSSLLASMMWALGDHAVWDEPLVGALFGRLYHDVTDEERRAEHFILGGDREVWLGSIRSFVLTGASTRFPEIVDGGSLLVNEPHGSLGAPLLMQALPESRMIFVVRDPRDVVAASLDAQEEGSRGPELPKADEDEFAATRARLLLRDVEQAKLAYDAHEGRKILVRYEDLVAEPSSTLRRIYSALKMPVDEAELARVVEIFSWEDVPERNEGLGKRRRGTGPTGWKRGLTPGQARLVEQIAAPLLREFYPR